MLKRKIEPRGDEIEIFVPEDQKERDLLAGIVNRLLIENYCVLAAKTKQVAEEETVWPEYVAFGMILTRARQVGLYTADPIDPGLMGLYFRAYVTTDSEGERVLIDLVMEDNNEKHLDAICELVVKKKPSAYWTTHLALDWPAKFMWEVNEAMTQEPDKRTLWVTV